MESLTLKSYIQQVESGSISPVDVSKLYLEKATKDQNNLHAFVRLHPEYVENNINSFKDLLLH